jgi:hypothetical protein
MGRLPRADTEWPHELESTGRKADSPLNSQVGGRHYNQYSIQPIEYAMANKMNYCQANAVKYVTRYKDKNGLEDLRKAIHNIEILIEMEYGDTPL